MNTKVKLGIAAAIVAALVALIVLDQKTATPPEPKGASPSSDTTVSFGPQPAAVRTDPAMKLREEQIDSLEKSAQRRVGGVNPEPQPERVEKGPTPLPGKEIKPAGEEYVVVDGDSYEKIAKKKLGDGKYWNLIAEANPTVKASALRPGKTIIVPPKPEPKVAPTVEPKPDLATKIEEPKKVDSKELPVFSNGTKGERLYTVQAGDTLSGISVKVYNTSRYVNQIHEANKEKLEDPSMLYVGMKLVMPDLPRKEAVASVAPGTGAVRTASPDASGKKTYTVQPGENLWKIAAKIAGDKGIEETMRAIVGMNPDKLKSIADTVRSGWQLLMPE
jgi:nucleoid-associated protein YgaU